LKGLTVNVMTALNQAGVTDMIDQTPDNIRRGSQGRRPRNDSPDGARGCWLATHMCGTASED
jgi:hypothetical protein